MPTTADGNDQSPKAAHVSENGSPGLKPGLIQEPLERQTAVKTLRSLQELLQTGRHQANLGERLALDLADALA
jgi:hypothetical protein